MIRMLLHIALLVLSQCRGELINREVVRVIDGSAAIVKTTIDIKAEGVQGEYILLFPNSQAASLAYLTVTSQNQELEVAAPVMYANKTTLKPSTVHPLTVLPLGM